MNYKKSFVVFLALMLIPAFLMTIVSAAAQATNPTTTTASGSGVGVFKQLWDAFFAGIFPSGNAFSIGSYEVSITQILLGLLVVLLVYSISDFIPLLPKGWIQWAFAFIVGILGFLFLDAETIKNIGDTYQALGVALVSVIPLLVLIGFSIKLSRDDNGKIWAPFIDKFVFLIFGLWMILKWSANQGGLSDYSVVYLASALIAILWVFAAKGIKRLINKEKEKAREDSDVTAGEDKALVRMRNYREELLNRRTALSGRMDNDSLEEKSKLNKEIIQVDKDIKQFIAKKQG